MSYLMFPIWESKHRKNKSSHIWLCHCAINVAHLKPRFIVLWCSRSSFCLTYPTILSYPEIPPALMVLSIINDYYIFKSLSHSLSNVRLNEKPWEKWERKTHQLGWAVHQTNTENTKIQNLPQAWQCCLSDGWRPMCGLCFQILSSLCTGKQGLSFVFWGIFRCISYLIFYVVSHLNRIGSRLKI